MDEKKQFSSLKWIILFIAVLVLLSINSYYELIALNIHNDKVNLDNSFRVMTYNVNATLGNENSETVKTGLLKEIYKQSPDILCLQELSPRIAKNVRPALDSLFVYKDSMSVKKPSRYLIFSKMPIRNFKPLIFSTKIDTLGLDSVKDE